MAKRTCFICLGPLMARQGLHARTGLFSRLRHRPLKPSLFALGIAFLCPVEVSSSSPLTSQHCTSTTTPIHKVQGRGFKSAFVNETLSVKGVVTGNFSGASQLGGVYLQALPKDHDQDPLTSEGIFVDFNGLSAELSVGDLILVKGKIAESHGSTRIRLTRAPTICAKNLPIKPTSMRLPSSARTLEALEGMMAEVVHPLVVIDNSAFEKWGELTLAAQRHSVTAPPHSNALASTATINTLILDDNHRTTFPQSSQFPINASPEQLRAGNKVEALRGIVDYQFGHYRIQPTTAPRFELTNPRPTAPPPPQKEQIRLASFNLKNYFNGPQFPTQRGARSRMEFEQQQRQIVAAITALNADVIGLQELENDGYKLQSSIQSLVQALNRELRNGENSTYSNTPSSQRREYGFIQPPTPRLGKGRIAVGLLYRIDRLAPLPNRESPPQQLFSHRNRIPLTQSFLVRGKETQFTVSVNHFKSKSGCPSGNKNRPNQDHGMGCWNAIRSQAAANLSAWLIGSTPTHRQPIFILGDLNSYPSETPLREFAAAGFQDLLQSSVKEPQNYSYLYQGQPGRLDYILLYPSTQATHIAEKPPFTVATNASATNASATTKIRVNRAGIWHINADEIRRQQRVVVPSKGWIGSSDHDPVFVDVEFPALLAF